MISSTFQKINIIGLYQENTYFFKIMCSVVMMNYNKASSCSEGTVIKCFMYLAHIYVSMKAGNLALE
jgi:hypothetical protein